MKRLLLLALLLTLCLPVQAWNARGHKTIAAIAYRNLTPEARSRVDRLLALHPEYAEWTSGLPAGEKGLAAFLQASVWPDRIRSGEGGYRPNDCRAPTPNLGYDRRAQNAFWHYRDQGFSTDGTPVSFPNACPEDILTQTIRLQAILGNPEQPDALQSFALVWLVHLVGDMHQPMHSVSRFWAQNRDGDLGGNETRLEPLRLEPGGREVTSLHALWDNLPGSDDSPAEATALADLLTAGYLRQPVPEPALASRWLAESAALGRFFAHSVAPDPSLPTTVPDAYLTYARSVALHRLALAGYRLADIINRRLG